jgi:hypothetical protein
MDLGNRSEFEDELAAGLLLIAADERKALLASGSIAAVTADFQARYQEVPNRHLASVFGTAAAALWADVMSDAPLETSKIVDVAAARAAAYTPRGFRRRWYLAQRRSQSRGLAGRIRKATAHPSPPTAKREIVAGSGTGKIVSVTA